MSQIKFWTDKGLEVMAGWDRPMGHFHFTVFDKNGEPTYCNLEEGLMPEDFNTAKSVYNKAMAEMDIEPPEGMWGLVKLSVLEPNAVIVRKGDQWDRVS